VTTIVKSKDVHAPIARVYNQWTQFEEFPQFMDGVERVEQLDDRRLRWTVAIAGVRREFEAEITEQHPEERVAWRSVDGTTHAGVVTFHKLGPDHTRVTVQIDWAPDGIAEKAGSAVKADDHQVAADLERFKGFVEAVGSETGAWRGEILRDG